MIGEEAPAAGCCGGFLFNADDNLQFRKPYHKKSCPGQGQPPHINLD
jgi:hypothetical protein